MHDLKIDPLGVLDALCVALIKEPLNHVDRLIENGLLEEYGTSMMFYQLREWIRDHING